MNYVVADLFDWQADAGYDAVFFSFWLSHVPRSRFGEFWLLLALHASLALDVCSSSTIETTQNQRRLQRTHMS